LKESILKLLRDRYFIEGESSWEELTKRVSDIYPEIENDILEMRFIPSTPTLMNANTGGKREGTLSSCFPMKLEDSIEGIYDSIKECALVTKACGGVGYDFSPLRSSYEIIKTLNNAKSSGPMPFLSNFNDVLNSINQGGARKGAGGGILSVYHPDILNFIRSKVLSLEIKKLVADGKIKAPLARFNLSVKMYNDFYDKLDNQPNDVHKVKFKNGKSIKLIDGTFQEVSVEELWDEIIELSWANAEPSLINYDIAWDRCSVKNVDTTVCPNPCIPEFSILLTPYGPKQLKDLNIGDCVWSGEGWTKITNKWSSGIKKVHKWVTSAGHLYATDNHQIMSKGLKIELKKAENIDVLVGNYEKFDEFDLQLIMDGLIVGDGSRNLNPGKNYDVYLTIGENDHDYFNSEISSFILKKTYPSDPKTYRVKTNVKKEELDLLPIREIPERYMYTTSNSIKSFLRGLYSANGSICGERVTLKATSLKLIEQVQIMLSSIGIKSYYTTNKPSKIKWDNGEYISKKSYDLNITSDRDLFYHDIAFIQKYKNDKLAKIVKEIKKSNRNKVNFDIKEKTELGEMEVFDITVDNDSHTFWCNGLNISNCFEFINVPYASCNLGSINLVKFVDDGEFNWDELGRQIKRSVIFLDKVIDVNKFPIPKIKEVTEKIRPIGLGEMGLAHAMYKLRIPYDSQLALNFTEKINRYMTIKGMEVSVKIAVKLGPYPAFDYDVFMDANKRFFTEDKILDVNIKQLKLDIKKYGIRNSCITSIAPTGSISTIADTSSGIEPVFALTYKRKVELGNGEYEIMYQTDPVFDEFLSENYLEDKSKILLEVSLTGSCQESKYLSDEHKAIFQVSNDLTPMEHLNILEKVANNVSLSVSKTLNLPENISKKEISDIYKAAHKKGIIGVTVYRKGSREGILITNDEDCERCAPKRPKSVHHDVHRVQVNGEKWIVFIGIVDDCPYETFAGKIENVDIPSKVKEVNIIKATKGRYQIEIEDEIIISDLNAIFDNKTHEAVTRLVSTCLRHQVPLHFIIEQINKSGGLLADFEKCIARALKKYIKEGTKSTEKCQCGGELIFQEGCVKCPKCSWSRCG
jgi:ribonucleoside-diphosphate reductase alpha chain